ncbi:MAG: hypothetical protein CL888_02790 [Dehalococcoidia bacterium]|nr:hypothetical protein [Dehalococcoidia bacterium]
MKSIDVIKKHFLESESIITIGTFDGVHKGHELVFKQIKNYTELLPLVITFKKSPKDVINNNEVRCIYDIKTKEKLISEFGIKEIISIDFDDTIKTLTAENFIELLKRHFKLKLLVIGEDATIGKDKIGKKNGLGNILKKYDCDLKTINIKKDDNEKISSSELKKLIEMGEIKTVNKNLSKDYFIQGKIIEGKKIGRELGYPTANLDYSKEIVIPQDGIYKTNSIFKSKKFLSITSIGNNPTFNEKIKTIETYIIDFNKNIYGENLKIIFKDYIRGQIKFENKEDLINQMNKDLKNVSEEN